MFLKSRSRPQYLGDSRKPYKAFWTPAKKRDYSLFEVVEVGIHFRYFCGLAPKCKRSHFGSRMRFKVERFDFLARGCDLKTKGSHFGSRVRFKVEWFNFLPIEGSKRGVEQRKPKNA